MFVLKERGKLIVEALKVLTLLWENYKLSCTYVLHDLKNGYSEKIGIRSIYQFYGTIGV